MRWLLAAALLASSACMPARIFSRNFVGFFQASRKLEHRIKNPVRDDARLAVLWVGHATLLIQIDDKIILTDPVFVETVGQLSRRLVEPGIAAEHLPDIDVCLISHMHLDHLSYDSLKLLEPKIKSLLVPHMGLAYIPEYRFVRERVRRFQTHELSGIRFTPVPVKHAGWRYGIDSAWMENSYTAWVIQYNGVTVYFGGDSAYDRANFEATRKRFPDIDVAILGIGPVEPYVLARPNHMEGREAVRAAEDLGASVMIPMHFDTFPHGLDPVGTPGKLVQLAAKEAEWPPGKLRLLDIGEQTVVIPTSTTAFVSR